MRQLKLMRTTPWIYGYERYLLPDGALLAAVGLLRWTKHHQPLLGMFLICIWHTHADTYRDYNISWEYGL